MDRKIVGLGLLSTLVLASCGQPNTDQAKLQFCKDLAELKQSVATLEGLSANSTVKALKDAQKQVETSFNKVKASAAKVNSAKSNDLEVAYNNLDKAVKGISDKATIQQAIASVQDEVQAVNTAQNAIYTGIQCTP